MALIAVQCGIQSPTVLQIKYSKIDVFKDLIILICSLNMIADYLASTDSHDMNGENQAYAPPPVTMQDAVSQADMGNLDLLVQNPSSSENELNLSERVGKCILMFKNKIVEKTENAFDCIFEGADNLCGHCFSCVSSAFSVFLGCCEHSYYTAAGCIFYITKPCSNNNCR